jgi:hypothetical protein
MLVRASFSLLDLRVCSLYAHTCICPRASCDTCMRILHASVSVLIPVRVESVYARLGDGHGPFQEKILLLHRQEL